MVPFLTSICSSVVFQGTFGALWVLLKSEGRYCNVLFVAPNVYVVKFEQVQALHFLWGSWLFQVLFVTPENDFPKFKYSEAPPMDTCLLSAVLFVPTQTKHYLASRIQTPVNTDNDTGPREILIQN